ncbi:hypothetical protein [Nocardia sp. NPDC059239]|uniref:hypothetical protein n=1 Tax=Nocardia sp. NPDC059239 TaxID=3346785 RepID=UPI003699F2CA
MSVRTAATQFAVRVTANSAVLREPRDFDLYLSGPHADPVFWGLRAELQRYSRWWMSPHRRLRIYASGHTLQHGRADEQALVRAWFYVLLLGATTRQSRWIDAELDWWLNYKTLDQVVLVDPGEHLDAYGDREQVLPRRLDFCDVRIVSPVISAYGRTVSVSAATAPMIAHIVRGLPPPLHATVPASVGMLIRDIHWLMRGLLMSLAVVLAVAAGGGGGDDAVVLAATAAAAVPVVGSAMTSFGSELRRIARTDLRRTLLTSQIAAAVSVVAFVAAVIAGVSGHVAETDVVYTALSSGTLGGVSLMIGQRARTSRRYALDLDEADRIDRKPNEIASAAERLVNQASKIGNNAERDRVRAEILLNAGQALLALVAAPPTKTEPPGQAALQPPTPNIGPPSENTSDGSES